MGEIILQCLSLSNTSYLTSEKRMTIIQLTTSKRIGHKYSCIISKKLPDTSEVTELDKTTFADTLNMFRQGKVRVEPSAQVLD